MKRLSIQSIPSRCWTFLLSSARFVSRSLSLSLFLFLFLFLLLPASSGCGGSAVSNPEPDARVLPDSHARTWEVRFTPEASHTASDIWLELGEVDTATGRFTLLLKGDGPSVYGVSGRLRFDPAGGAGIVGLDSAQPGPALSASQTKVVAAGRAIDEKVVFGASRVGEADSVTSTPDSHIAVLVFQAQQEGSAILVFDGGRSRVMDHQLQIQTVNRWLGGTIEVIAH